VDGVATVRDFSLDIFLHGDFAAAYLWGDNSTTLPTDSMRNHAAAVADEMPRAEPETCGGELLRRLLAAVPAAEWGEVALTIHPWSPLDGDHVFLAAPWVGRATVTAQRDGAVTISGGIGDLLVLTPFGSGFAGFLRDAMTDQEDAFDRVLSGRVEASWRYGGDLGAAGFGEIRRRVYGAITRAVGAETSLGVQQTVYSMGAAALAAAPELEEITLVFAARPHSPVGTAAWAAGESPVGVTEATVRRDG
jgi:urate oxidase